MKEGWTRGVMLGAIVGVSTMAVATMLNQNNRRRMMNAMSGAAYKVADKAEQILK